MISVQGIMLVQLFSILKIRLKTPENLALIINMDADANLVIFTRSTY